MRKRDELERGCMAKARDDEMTFVLLGRDHAAPAAIRAWIEERLRLRKNQPDDPQIVEAEECAKAMEREQGVRTDAPEADTDLRLAALRCMANHPGLYSMNASEADAIKWAIQFIDSIKVERARMSKERAEMFCYRNRVAELAESIGELAELYRADAFRPESPNWR